MENPICDSGGGRTLRLPMPHLFGLWTAGGQTTHIPTFYPEDITSTDTQYALQVMERMVYKYLPYNSTRSIRKVMENPICESGGGRTLRLPMLCLFVLDYTHPHFLAGRHYE